MIRLAKQTKYFDNIVSIFDIGYLSAALIIILLSPASNL